jgi:hypothetical protein
MLKKILIVLALIVVGDDFEKGLNNLKTVSEAAPERSAERSRS